MNRRPITAEGHLADRVSPLTADEPWGDLPEYLGFSNSFCTPCAPVEMFCASLANLE
jgi:hypothetical protein